MPIDYSNISFYIITIDFILALLTTIKDFNNLLIIIYKFSKRVLVILR